VAALFAEEADFLVAGVASLELGAVFLVFAGGVAVFCADITIS
jgi:hypothetical protein